MNGSPPGSRNAENPSVRKWLEGVELAWTLLNYESLSALGQARIVPLLVERVEIAEDGLDIGLRTDGLAGLVREFGVDARAAA